MIVYELIPFHGVGPVLLGMSRDQVQAVMGERPDSFKKPPYPSLIDAYHKAGFQVYFDEDDRVEFIELSSLDAPYVVVYRSMKVFEVRADDLVESVSRDTHSEPQQPEPGYSYLFPQLGLSFWREFVPEDDTDPDGQFFSTVGIGTREFFARIVSMRSE